MKADTRQCETGGESICDGRVDEVGCIGEQRSGKHEIEGLHRRERVISGGNELHQRIVVEHADLHTTDELRDKESRLRTHIIDQFGVASRVACVGTDINSLQTVVFPFRFLGARFFKRALALLSEECRLCSHRKRRRTTSIPWTRIRVAPVFWMTTEKSTLSPINDGILRGNRRVSIRSVIGNSEAIA